MEIRPGLLRTPDARFAGLPDYDFAPRHVDVPDPATIGWESMFQRRVAGARGQPHARIAGAGHFMQEEQGVALAAVLTEFLRNNHR